MYKRIPLSAPAINGKEWKYIKECLDTEWVSSAGKYVDLFEEKIAEYTGAKYAIAVVNGTSALHLSLLVCGVGNNDEVIIPSLTFIAPVNAIRYVGASPIFMDSGKYYNLDTKKTIEFIHKETEYKNGYTFNKSTKKKILALIPVHVFGNAVWLDELIQLCKERNIRIIEDATESLGSKYMSGLYKEQSTGTIGDIGCLSFNGNKIITTGGGGMILTNNKEYAEKTKYLSTQAKDDSINYIHDEVGYNYRMTNIQAAMGVAQLEQLSEFIESKKRIYTYYEENLKNIVGISLVHVPNYADNNHWLNAIRIDEKEFGKSTKEVIELFEKNNIEARPVWYPNHLQKQFRKFQTYKIENTIKLWKSTLNIPSSANISFKDIRHIIKCVQYD